MGDDLSLYAENLIQVETASTPDPKHLLVARALVKEDPELRRVFLAAKAEQWSPEKLAEALTAGIQDPAFAPDSAAQVARYLADEYTQVGDAILLVSSVSGKALAQITDKDIWQAPTMVPREGGSLAKPLPRIRPELEAFLVQWVFDTEREEAATRSAMERFRPSSLQHGDKDRRLRLITRGGRRKILEDLQEAAPTLLNNVKGTSKAFLSHFATEPQSEWVPIVECLASSRVRLGIEDLKSLNLQFDAFTALGATIATSWVRDIARTLCLATTGTTIDFESVRELDVAGFPTWVVPADLAVLFARFSVSGLYVDGMRTRATGLGPGIVGALQVKHDKFEVGGIEVSDRLEVIANCTYSLWYDPAKVKVLDIQGVPVEGEVVDA